MRKLVNGAEAVIRSALDPAPFVPAATTVLEPRVEFAASYERIEVVATGVNPLERSTIGDAMSITPLAFCPMPSVTAKTRLSANDDVGSTIALPVTFALNNPLIISSFVLFPSAMSRDRL